MIFSLLSYVALIVFIVCWVMNLITAFKKEESPLFGILSICGIIGLILGWVKHKEWGHKQIMLIWTAAFVAQILFSVLAGVFA